MLGLVINGIAVGTHHPERAPRPYQVDTRQQRKGSNGAPGDGGHDGGGSTDIEAHVLFGVAALYGSLTCLPDMTGRIAQKGPHPLGHQNLAAVWNYWRRQSQLGCQTLITQTGRQDDPARAPVVIPQPDPECSIMGLDSIDGAAVDDAPAALQKGRV